MSIPYVILANTSIDAESNFTIEPLRFKGKGTLLFSCQSEGVTIELSYTPINAASTPYPLETPMQLDISDPLVNLGWIKLLDLPEGVLKATIFTGSVSSSVSLTFMPNEY